MINVSKFLAILCASAASVRAASAGTCRCPPCSASKRGVKGYTDLCRLGWSVGSELHFHGFRSRWTERLSWQPPTPHRSLSETKTNEATLLLRRRLSQTEWGNSWKESWKHFTGQRTHTRASATQRNLLQKVHTLTCLDIHS